MKTRVISDLRSLDKDTNADEIEPVRWFPCKDAYSNFIINPISCGIEPLNLLLSRLRETGREGSKTTRK